MWIINATKTETITEYCDCIPYMRILLSRCFRRLILAAHAALREGNSVGTPSMSKTVRQPFSGCRSEPDSHTQDLCLVQVCNPGDGYASSVREGDQRGAAADSLRYDRVAAVAEELQLIVAVPVLDQVGTSCIS